jgi:hypothetical protein
MPLYEVRLEAQDGSGHYRKTTLLADTEEAASARCEESERAMVAFRIDPGKAAEILDGRPEKTIDEIDLDPANVRAQFAGAHRAWLLTHAQDTPYEVTSVTELDPHTKQAKAGAK